MMIIDPIEFAWEGQRYRALIRPVPRTPVPDGELCWFVITDRGNEIGPLFEADENDQDDEKLHGRLMEAASAKLSRWQFRSRE